MRLGIMQPYFFPYIGHFSLIAHTDMWIVFDITQYTPKTWMNRNRVLHPTEGSNWVSVPLVNSSISIKTKDAQVQDIQAAKQMVLGKISHYKRKAPYFSQVEALVHQTFALEDGDTSLVHLNVRSLDAVCQYLGLPFNRKICSELQLTFPENMGAGDWALEISSALGADAYLNPYGGQLLFDPNKFQERGIALDFLKFKEFSYETHPYQFISGLSILDVLMWSSPKDIRKAMIENVEFMKPTSDLAFASVL